MPNADLSPEQRALGWAFAVSLAIHLLLLLDLEKPPQGGPTAPARLEARLAPVARVAAEPPRPNPAPVEKKPASKPSAPHPRLLTTEKSRDRAVPSAPQWTAAEKAEMDGFLNELANQPRAQAKPTLAERSLAMARQVGREMAAQQESDEAVLEARPNGPPVDFFSLEMYIDGLLRRLNRSAAYVKNEPRNKGIRPASIQFRLNPDGSLKSFVVLNAGDQAEEIAFIKSVVERAVPFSPFPPDLDKAARSLGVTICIRPSGGGGGLGFSRMSGNRCR